MTPLLTTFATLALSSSPVPDIAWETDYGAAQERAALEGKLLFLDFYAEWCGPCKEMERDTWPREDVQAWLAGTVCMRIDAGREGGHPLAREFGVSSYPTLILLHPSGRVLVRESGKPPGEQFVQFFWNEHYNEMVSASNAKDAVAAAPHVQHLQRWFPKTQGGEIAGRIHARFEKEAPYLEAYGAAKEAEDEELRVAREAAEKKRAELRRAAELEAEAQKLYAKIPSRKRSYDVYRTIITEFPDLPEAERAREVLRKHKQRWKEPD